MKTYAVLLTGFFILVLFIFKPQILTADGTYSNLGTGDAADGSADAINFSQGRVWTIDQYGKYIWLTENRTGGHHWTWSNNLGTNWTQGSEEYDFLTRGSVAYDSINDVLHVIWAATDSNDGIIYRRYSITRDGSNNITAISRVDSGTVNLQLDTSASRNLEQPVALWINDGSADGILVAVWTKQGGSINEVRGSMRKLSMTGADGVAGNWAALDGTGDSFSTDPPAVAADKIFGDTTGSNASSALVRGGSGARQNDLYVFVQESDDNSADSVLGYRAVWDSGDGDWGGGWQSPVTVGPADMSSGYFLKEQLITKPVLDETNDRLYVGWARWKSGGDGDTVSFAYLNSSDSPSSTFDAYSALGTHSYAPTLDIAFDNTLGQLYVSYLESTTNGDNGSIDYKTFDGTSLSTETRFYTSPGGSAGENGSADIPILYESRSSNNRLLFAFRVNGALPPTAGDPHQIYWGYIPLGTATPTPTPTSTPSPSASSQTSTSSSTNTSSGPPSCSDTTPNSTPNLFQIDTAGTFAQLHFTTVSGPLSGYQVNYGLGQSTTQYSDQFSYTGPQWTYNRVIGGLSPNTTYSFKIQAVNGCTAGNWSQTIMVKTKSRFADITSKLASLNPFKTAPTPPGQTPAKSPTACIYTVQPGDTLWKIAQNYLGSGSKFTQIIISNPDIFTGGISGSIIKVGWKLKVC